jgi:hypothetical protein
MEEPDHDNDSTVDDDTIAGGTDATSPQCRRAAIAHSLGIDDACADPDQHCAAGSPWTQLAGDAASDVLDILDAPARRSLQRAYLVELKRIGVKS